MNLLRTWLATVQTDPVASTADVEFKISLTVSIDSDLHVTNCKSPQKKTVSYKYVNVSHFTNRQTRKYNPSQNA